VLIFVQLANKYSAFSRTQTFISVSTISVSQFNPIHKFTHIIFPLRLSFPKSCFPFRFPQHFSFPYVLSSSSFFIYSLRQCRTKSTDYEALHLYNILHSFVFLCLSYVGLSFSLLCSQSPSVYVAKESVTRLKSELSFVFMSMMETSCQCFFICHVFKVDVTNNGKK